jgi:23S rRNA pseudouridine2457 synthase
MLLAFHKPYGFLSQFTPEPGSRWRTLADFGFPKNVYPIGRLDADSEGLLLLSDEAELNRRLLHPTQGHIRTYWVQVEGIPSEIALGRLRRGGLALGTDRTLPCRARVRVPSPPVAPRVPPIRVRKNIPDAWLELGLQEGKNRQVRRMTAAVGHPTLRLIRAAIGRYTLQPIAPGVWQEINDQDRALLWLPPEW